MSLILYIIFRFLSQHVAEVAKAAAVLRHLGGLFNVTTDAGVRSHQAWTSTHHRHGRVRGGYILFRRYPADIGGMLYCAENNNTELVYHHQITSNLIATFFVSPPNNKRVIDDHRGNATYKLTDTWNSRKGTSLQTQSPVVSTLLAALPVQNIESQNRRCYAFAQHCHSHRT